MAPLLHTHRAWFSRGGPRPADDASSCRFLDSASSRDDDDDDDPRDDASDDADVGPPGRCRESLAQRFPLAPLALLYRLDWLYGDEQIALAQQLLADHLDLTVSASEARSDLAQHPPAGLSSAQRQLLLGELRSITGTVSPAALTASVPSAAYASQYRSITLTDLASVVNGLVHNRDFSIAVGRTLVADLSNAQHACADARRRTAARSSVHAIGETSCPNRFSASTIGDRAGTSSSAACAGSEETYYSGHSR